MYKVLFKKNHDYFSKYYNLYLYFDFILYLFEMKFLYFNCLFIQKKNNIFELFNENILKLFYFVIVYFGKVYEPFLNLLRETTFIFYFWEASRVLF